MELRGGGDQRVLPTSKKNYLGLPPRYLTVEPTGIPRGSSAAAGISHMRQATHCK